MPRFGFFSDGLPLPWQKIHCSCWYHFIPKEGILTLKEVQLSNVPAIALLSKLGVCSLPWLLRCFVSREEIVTVHIYLIKPLWKRTQPELTRGRAGPGYLLSHWDSLAPCTFVERSLGAVFMEQELLWGWGLGRPVGWSFGCSFSIVCSECGSQRPFSAKIMPACSLEPQKSQCQRGFLFYQQKNPQEIPASEIPVQSHCSIRSDCAFASERGSNSYKK